MNGDCSICPQCGQKTMTKPTRFYRVFEKTRQPNGVCPCGHFHWGKNGFHNVLSTALVLYREPSRESPVVKSPLKEKILVANNMRHKTNYATSDLPELPPKLAALLKEIQSTGKFLGRRRHKRYHG